MPRIAGINHRAAVRAHGGARGARPEDLEIARLYVRPEVQRRGVGRSLLAAARAAFPDLSRVRLEVEAQNPKGRAFYVKVGFEEVGERTVEVEGHALHLIVMALDDRAATRA